MSLKKKKKICLYLHCMQVMGWAALHTIQGFMATRPTWGCWRFIRTGAVLKQGCRESRVLRETVGWDSIPTWNPSRHVLMPSPGQKMPKPMEVQFCSVPQSCPTLCSPMDCSIPGFPIGSSPIRRAITSSQSLLKFISIESLMPSNHPILCQPLLLPSLFPSIRVFSNESVLHIRWPKY